MGGGRRDGAARVAATGGYEVRGDAVARFRAAHPEVDDDASASRVQAGLLQWFRVVAHDPTAGFVLPSKAVAELWLETARDDAPYAALCAAAFAGTLPWTPPWAPGGDGRGLLRTLAAARADQGTPSGGLPLLFRLDEEVGVADARRYLADCGGGADCHPMRGRTCLRHPDGGRYVRPSRVGEVPGADVGNVQLRRGRAQGI